MPNTLLATGLVLLSVAPPEGAALNRFHFAEPHMGTRFQITLYALGEAAAQAGAKAAFERIAALDAMMSDYRTDSELMRLCRQAGHVPGPVSEDLFLVLSTAQEVSRRSGGAFDVTVGPIVRLWRRARRTQQLPDADQMAAARALVGYQYVHLDPAHRTVRLEKQGMLLDLGGIAKGYSADAALVVLKQHGISSALVAAGGDIAVSGPPPGQTGWKVGIASLDNPEGQPAGFIWLHDAAVSTSGDAEQHVEIGGRRYSHIVDPRSGLGLTGRRSVTVVAPKGIMADSLTKVVSVLGPEPGLKIIASFPGASAYAIFRTEAGPQTVKSPGFPTMTSNNPGPKTNG
jgi:thiamine biosynthesis lipoprotein